MEGQTSGRAVVGEALDQVDQSTPSDYEQFLRKMDLMIIVYDKLLAMKPVPLEKVKKKLAQIEAMIAEELSQQRWDNLLEDLLATLQRQYEEANEQRSEAEMANKVVVGDEEIASNQPNGLSTS